jgi:hypothetical protein
VLRTVILTRHEITRGWEKSHNEELQNLYSSPNNVIVSKSGRLRWMGHVARLGKFEMHTTTQSDNAKVLDQSGDLGVDERIILKWNVEK